MSAIKYYIFYLSNSSFFFRLIFSVFSLPFFPDFPLLLSLSMMTIVMSVGSILQVVGNLSHLEINSIGNMLIQKQKYQNQPLNSKKNINKNLFSNESSPLIG